MIAEYDYHLLADIIDADRSVVIQALGTIIGKLFKVGRRFTLI